MKDILAAWATASTTHQVLILALAGAAGIALGKIRIAGVSLGIVGVLFVGLLFGHFGLVIDAHVLEFLRDFGFVLFAYTLGLQIGPGFVGALKQRGLWLNLCATLVVTAGVGLAVAWIVGAKVPLPTGLGVFSGATTSTPSFAAAQQAFKQLGANDDTMIRQSLGYAVAYPCGILALILTFVLIRLCFRIDVRAEADALHRQRSQSAGPAPEARNFEVTNPNLASCLLSRVPGVADVVISRLSRAGRVEVAQPDQRLQLGDILHAVGTPEKLEALRLVVGVESKTDLKQIPGEVTNRRVLVSQNSVLGHTLDELVLLAQRPVVVTRVLRGGMEFIPDRDWRVRFGDILMVVGEPSAIDDIASAVGNSPKALDTPQLIPLFLGVALGMVAGMIPLALPHLPAAVKLGIAGGPLLIGILLGRTANTGPLVWHLPPSASQVLRDLGIALFLAGVGMKSGEHFAEVMASGAGWSWIGWGFVLSFVPLLIIGFAARLITKINYAELCGLLAGSMTDSPALAFAQQMTGSDAPAVAYATVYPFTMLLRVLSAQLLVFFLF